MEIGSVVRVIHLLIAPVAKVWMKLGCQRSEDFRRPADLGNIHKGRNLSMPRNYHCTEPYLCLVTHSYSDEVVLGRIQYLLHKFDA